MIPGFVDSHTHLVFAGERSDEFEARMAGLRYDGGGIMRTVAATRAATLEELYEGGAAARGRARAGGVTTIEIKSGYELTTEGEVPVLEVAAAFTEDAPGWVRTSCRASTPTIATAYVDLLMTTMLDACAPARQVGRRLL